MDGWMITVGVTSATTCSAASSTLSLLASESLLVSVLDLTTFSPETFDKDDDDDDLFACFDDDEVDRFSATSTAPLIAFGRVRLARDSKISFLRKIA